MATGIYKEKPKISCSGKPRVSIGLPVFNGETYLKAALDSILNQTFSDFELIICDNASTDNTSIICREYEAMDSRIHYYRNKINLGAPANYNRTVKFSRGEYFKWAAADDVHAPEYLQKCVEVLDKEPSIVLCHSKSWQIDEQGAIVGTYDHKMRINSKKIQERFGDLMSMYNPRLIIYGLIRKEVLEKTPLHGEYRGSDGNLLAELSLYGPLYEIPEYLFLRRDHSQAYTRRFHTNQKIKTPYSLDEQKLWWSSTSWFNFTYLKNSLEFFDSLRRVPLKRSERILCYWEISKWFVKEGWKLIGDDIEHYVLSRFAFGFASVKVVKKILRRIGIRIIEEET